MTNKELIEQLTKLPPHLPVCFAHCAPESSYQDIYNECPEIHSVTLIEDGDDSFIQLNDVR